MFIKINCFSWENVWRMEAAWVRHEGRPVGVQAGCIQQLQPGASYRPVQHFRARRSFFTQGQLSLQMAAVKRCLQSSDCHYCSRDRIDDTVTSLQAGRLRNRGSIFSRYRRFFILQNEFWVPYSLLHNGYRGLSPRNYSDRGEKLTTPFHTVPKLRIIGVVSPFQRCLYSLNMGVCTFALLYRINKPSSWRDRHLCALYFFITLLFRERLYSNCCNQPLLQQRVFCRQIVRTIS